MTVVPPPEIADRLAELDRAHLFHPWTPVGVSDQLVIESGHGCEVTDTYGRTYLDARSGQFNAALGYGHPRVLAALLEQGRRLMTYALLGASNKPAVQLAARLAELLGEPLTRTFFCNSGSEATEAAVRIARMYHGLRGQPERTTVLSLADGYHGTTLATAAMSASPIAWAGCGPTPDGFATIPTPTSADDAEALSAAIVAPGSGRVAAFVVEPVLGVGGIRPLPEGYLRAVREVCDRHGVLLVIDEVTTGFGRTGEWFAYRREGIRPDIITTGKGLTAGYAPLAAVTTTTAIADAFNHDPMLGGLRHGHTTSGHALAAAIALAVIQTIEDDGLVEHAAAAGERLCAGLTDKLTGMPGVREVRGIGLLAGIELDSFERAAGIVAACRREGIIVRNEGTVIAVAPPLIVSTGQVDQIVDTLAAAAAEYA